MRKPQLCQKDTLTPSETLVYFGLSKRKFDRFMAEGKAKDFTVYYGTRKLILRAKFERYLNSNRQVKEELMNHGRSKKT